MNLNNSLWREFHKLSAEEQKQAYVEFESKMRSWVDSNIYPKYGEIDRKQETDKHDLVLKMNSRDFKIEEKFRTSLWDDMNIELLGDVNPPLLDLASEKFVSKKMGWFYYCDADYILYSMSDSPIAKQPEEIYMINMYKLKRNFSSFIKERSYTLPPINHKGYGYSLNLAIDWKTLEENEIARRIYKKAHQPNL